MVIGFIRRWINNYKMAMNTSCTKCQNCDHYSYMMVGGGHVMKTPNKCNIKITLSNGSTLFLPNSTINIESQRWNDGVEIFRGTVYKFPPHYETVIDIESASLEWVENGSDWK